MAGTNGDRFVALDGWRGISILLVLASHLLPLGPSEWELNLAAGLLGMSFFFALSGFLVTQFLLNHPDTVDFLLRRCFRIVPLAWLFMALTLAFQQAPADLWQSHFLFYANLPPRSLTPITEHLWSLCVEMHFYLAIALLHMLLGRRGLLLLPVTCLLVTLGRIAVGEHYSSVTWLRIDEILAGATLALIYSKYRYRLGHFVSKIHPVLLLPLLLLACHPAGGFMTYLRPYFAALLIGITLFNRHSLLVGFLQRRRLVYIASISYALYVLHPALEFTWLGEGDPVEKYLKRPLLFLVLFSLAHLSTYYFEKPCIAFGKRLALRLKSRSCGPALGK